MAKTSQKESYWDTKYSQIVKERHQALSASPLFHRERTRWLNMVGRSSPFTSVDRWLAFSTPWLDTHLERRSELEKDARLLAARFAIPTWHVIFSLFVAGYRPESGQTPLDLRYPRTSVVMSGPASDWFEVLHRSTAGSGVQVVWEPFLHSGNSANSRRDLIGEIELPVEMPMDEAARLVRRSLRLVKYALKQLERPPSKEQSEICPSLVYHGSDIALFSKIDLAATEAGLQITKGPGLGPNAEDTHQTPNPLSYLMTMIRFSPYVRSADLVLSTRSALKASRQVCRSLGVNVGERVRTAPLVKLAEALAVNGKRLPDRGLGDLVLDQIQGFPRESGKPTEEARKMMSRVKSRRNQVLDRFKKKGMC